MSQTRKEFLGTLAKVAIGAAGVALIAACGDDDDGNTPTIDAAASQPDAPVATFDAAPGTPDAAPPIDAVPTSCVDNGAESIGAQISANHGHALHVPAADVVAGTDKTYDIQGIASHPHTVTLTASDFAVLAAGASIQKVSSTNLHMHTCTITCL